MLTQVEAGSAWVGAYQLVGSREVTAGTSTSGAGTTHVQPGSGARKGIPLRLGPVIAQASGLTKFKLGRTRDQERPAPLRRVSRG